MGQVLGVRFQTNSLKPRIQLGKVLELWTYKDILEFLKAYRKIPSSHGFFYGYSELKLLCKNTRAKGCEFQILKYFCHSMPLRVSILELTCAVLVYADVQSKTKLKLVFSVFDFDKNSYLSRDEFGIMAISLLNALGCMTDSSKPSSQEVFSAATSTFEKITKDLISYISFKEFRTWCIASQEVLNLLEFNRSGLRKSIPTKQVPPLKLRSLTPVLRKKAITDRAFNHQKFVSINNKKFTLNWMLELKKAFSSVENPLDKKASTQGLLKVFESNLVLCNHLKALLNLKNIYKRVTLEELVKHLSRGSKKQVKDLLCFAEGSKTSRH